MTIAVFFILLAFNPRRVDIPLVKITLAIQSVNTIALIIALLLNQIRITAEILCGSLRYILYTCYLTSIFMCTAVTVHLWIVITRRKLYQAKRNERWYYIIPICLASALAAALGVIPSSVYGMSSRCTAVTVPPKSYLAIRWGLYYGWFVIASAISFGCMVSVLRSTHKLTHSTYVHGRQPQLSTEAYRNAVNARANSQRLRSLVFYTIAYPVISFACNFPQLLQEIFSTAYRRELRGFIFVGRLFLFSEGFFLSLAFFMYPAVRHSIRDLTNSAVQYWVIDQEEFWHMNKAEIEQQGGLRALRKDPDCVPAEGHIIRDFTSWRGRLYHFFLSQTPEGRLVTSL
ncbi:hypothetical protein GGF46_002531 [Coemansia sp. RSA 552]|nr:hypothetical protein GGF46_002531 [Coemansia sp. RSA 552]